MLPTNIETIGPHSYILKYGSVGSTTLYEMRVLSKAIRRKNRDVDVGYDSQHPGKNETWYIFCISCFELLSFNHSYIRLWP
jgi:hypothetical protein